SATDKLSSLALCSPPCSSLAIGSLLGVLARNEVRSVIYDYRSDTLATEKIFWIFLRSGYLSRGMFRRRKKLGFRRNFCVENKQRLAAGASRLRFRQTGMHSV
ncbi:MAG: hypothetical protein AAB607_00065, partial [Patescibacteria group bacterium]